MAIKVTSKLIEDVTAHINVMRDTALKAEFGSPNDEIPFYPCDEDAEAMDALIWADYLNLKPQVPQSWCDEFIGHPGSYRRGQLTVFLDKDSKSQHPCFQLAIDTRNKRYFGPPNSHYVGSREIRRGKNPKLDELYDSLLKRREVFLKWGETLGKVTKVLEAAPTLNQAAKVWPEIIHFLPDERKEQYKKDIAPKVRKKADTSELEAALAEIDREAIAGDLVTFRFQTA
jgi:hypothetical protein